MNAQVNELPSFETDSPLDMSIKTDVITEAFLMVSPTVQVCLRTNIYIYIYIYIYMYVCIYSFSERILQYITHTCMYACMYVSKQT